MLQHIHKNTRETSVNLVGGQTPEGAKLVGTLQNPNPALNLDHDKDGAKIVLEAEQVAVIGATQSGASLNFEGGEEQLGAFGAPGVETPDDGEGEELAPAELGVDAGQLPGGDYDPDEESEAGEGETLPHVVPTVSRRKRNS